jgi:hypothetical protein
MTLYERLRKVEHWAAGAWLLVVCIAYTDTGVAFPLWMVLAAATIALAGWWLARTALSLALARDLKESWRSRLWLPAALSIGILLAFSNAPLIARLWLSESSLKQGNAGLFHVREFTRFDGGELRFLTSSCGLVDQCGLVYSPSGRPPNRGEDSFTHLYGSWWHWHQSW